MCWASALEREQSSTVVICLFQNALTDSKAKQEIKLCHNCLYSNDSCLDIRFKLYWWVQALFSEIIQWMIIDQNTLIAITADSPSGMTESMNSNSAIIILIVIRICSSAVFLLGENFINLVITNDVSKVSSQMFEDFMQSPTARFNAWP